MNLYIYSDESGVFDKIHNDIFVFGGLIFFSDEERNECARKYKVAENYVRRNESISAETEVKAATISNKSKDSLFRALNKYYKFGVKIKQQLVIDNIFKSKKDKQRYLDYAYKIAVKKALVAKINSKEIDCSRVKNISFFIDSHSTATNGVYELKESLEQEFKRGMYSSNYKTYYPPIFPYLQNVHLSFCDSKEKMLIRCADIVSNKVYYSAVKNKIITNDNIHVIKLP